jgi:hypothetical protein
MREPLESVPITRGGRSSDIAEWPRYRRRGMRLDKPAKSGSMAIMSKMTTHRLQFLGQGQLQVGQWPRVGLSPRP